MSGQAPPPYLLLFEQIPRGYTQLPTLPRTALVEKLHNAIQSSRFVLLSAPSEYGKTTVMNLFILRYTAVHCIPISFYTPDVIANELVATHGLDVLQKSCQLPQDVGKDQLVVFMLDDAQSKFEDKSFWNSLIEGSDQWLPANVRFVISAIHILAKGIHDRPKEIDRLSCKFTRDDFLLGNEEAIGLFYYPGIENDNRVPKQLESPELRDLIFRECNGHVGALTTVVKELCRVSRRGFKKSVEDVISFYKSDQLPKYIPCFSGWHMQPTPKLKSFLSKYLTGGLDCGPEWSGEDKECFTSLKAAGILTGSENSNIEFTCRLAERYYTKEIFPNRGVENPSSLHGLIRKVIGSMSMSFIERTITPTYEFPLTTNSFLAQVMTGIALWTLPSCPICPDISPTFPHAAHRIGDEFDFYVGAGLCWGIDVRLNGEETDIVEARLSTTEINTSTLPVTDFVVVDIRGTKTGGLENIPRTPNRVTVVFKLTDFSRCRCVFGESEGSELIHLQW
ncbi:hypothetical protein L917_18906 [Phytophthora nicotianae]|uniref:AAA-ATPase-like domain-containing protein n=1 Tax=Phytophthora nicotianae TaxID=4792 RepID=W2K7R0_PHYNI|nr:hypothetical protein L917_18906 [Phytophthora nicotianae]